jgi:nicotinamidase/pyrazinamidase
MKTLIVTDIQNDFLPGGALPVPRGDEVVPVANRLMDQFERVVATQDWHPASHESFASQHPGRRVGEVILLRGRPQILWPDHCIRETPGADFAPGLARQKIDHIIRKATSRQIDSYSAFFDNDHIRATGLEELLKREGVDDLSLIGLATDYCIKFTALDAAALGFRTTVLLEGCRGIERQAGDIERAIAEMRSAGVDVVPPSEGE